MKRSFYGARTVRVLASILAIGLLTAGVGFAMTGFELGKLSEADPYTIREYEAAPETIRSITIVDANRAIRVRPAEDGVVRALCPEREREGYRIDLSPEGALSIRYESTRKWYENLQVNWSMWDAELVLYLPDGFAPDLDAQTTNGSIRAEGVCLGEVSARSVNGAVAFEDVDILGSARLSATNGSLRLDGCSIGEEIDARTTNGSISLSRMAADRAFARTTNGRVSVELIGDADDYAIRARTVNGRVSAPEGNPASGRIVEVNSVNGSVTVGFAKE